MSQLPTASEVFAMWDPCSGNGGRVVPAQALKVRKKGGQQLEDNSGGQRREGMTRAERRMQKEKASKETEPPI